MEPNDITSYDLPPHYDIWSHDDEGYIKLNVTVLAKGDISISIKRTVKGAGWFSVRIPMCTFILTIGKIKAFLNKREPGTKINILTGYTKKYDTGKKLEGQKILTFGITQQGNAYVGIVEKEGKASPILEVKTPEFDLYASKDKDGVSKVDSIDFLVTWLTQLPEALILAVANFGRSRNGVNTAMAQPESSTKNYSNDFATSEEDIPF